MVSEIFNCEINTMLDKFFEPELVHSKKEEAKEQKTPGYDSFDEKHVCNSFGYIYILITL